MFWSCGVLLVAAAGCGKKGPPLAPIVRIPAHIDQIAARRVGGDVYVTLTVPTANIDASVPADVNRIDVYAYTGRTAPPALRRADLSTVIASVPVVPAARPGDPPAAAPDPAAGATQGASVTVVDRLTADELVQGPVDPPPPPRRGVAPLPAPAVTAPGPLRRFYFAVPFGPRDRPGPPGTAAELRLAALPDPPAALDVRYDPIAVTLSWPPAGGVVGFILDREIPREPSPLGEDVPAVGADVAAGPTRYNVYRDSEPDPLALPSASARPLPWQAAPPAPINAAPLQVLAFSDPAQFEVARCYSVRAVRGQAAAAAESEPSPRVCVRAVDVFPPSPPAAPAAVAGEGAISLIWEPSADADLGGYLVLRGEPGDATLQPLTPTPIAETNFRDTTVIASRRYSYAVVAVDNRVPLGNQSLPSDRVEETAR